MAVFLLVPALGWAQTFTETVGDVPGAPFTEGQTVNTYYGGVNGTPPNARKFDNDNERGFNYNSPAANSALISAQNTSPSGGRNIEYPAAIASNVQVTISDISTAALSNGQISFELFNPAATNVANAQFRVQYAVSTDGGATYAGFTNIAGATYTAGTNAWVTYTANLPAAAIGDYVALRFLRLGAAAANGTYRIDNIRLTGTTTPFTAVNPDQRLFPDTEVGQVSAAQLITVRGAGLSQPVTVTAPTGFQVRTGAGTFGTTATIAIDAAGRVPANSTFEVRFAPTAIGSTGLRNVTVTSGTASSSVVVTGTGTAAQPRVQASATSLPDFGNVQVGSVSSVQSFTVSGQNLGTNGVTILAPTGFQVRTTGAFGNSATIASNGSVTNATVEVRFVPVAIGAVSGNVEVQSAGATTQTVFVSGTGDPAPAGPNLTVTPATPLDFGNVTNSGSSQVLSFTVGGTNLTNDIVITPNATPGTPPVANIQIRNASIPGSTFSSAPITLTRDANGLVPTTTIETRLVPTVAGGTFTGSVTVASGTLTRTVNITANNPSNQTSDITVSGPLLTEFSTSPGIASAPQSFNVSGSNLLQDITLRAPQFYQISLSSNPASFPAAGVTGNSIVLPRITSGPNANNVPLTTIYVRYFPPTPQKDRGVFLEASSAPARTQFVSLNGSSAPEIELRDPFTFVRNQVKGTVSGPQAQSLRIRGARLSQPVTITVPNDAVSPLNPSGTPQFVISTSLNGTYGYSIQISPNPTNDSIGSATRIYVRYAPTRVGSAAADLTFQSQNFFNNVPFTLAPNSSLKGNSIDLEPTIQSQAIVTRSADRTSVTLNFQIPGDPEAAGFGENRLVIASVADTVLASANQFPQDGQAYATGNERYGFGAQIGGNYVVFAGSAKVITITDLNPALEYYFFGFEYNNDQTQGAENYKVPNLPLVQQPLPVELITFTAKPSKGRVLLDWSTAQEENNKGFEILRSRNGRDFTVIGTKEGRGTTAERTEYSFVDNTPLSGTSYYRLKQIDLDGKVTLTAIRTVALTGRAELTLFPNPVVDVLNIQVTDLAADAQVTVTDLLGRTVLSQTMPANGQLNLSSLKPGNYVVNVVSNGQKLTRKLVKR
ncbi:T9SS type A sorting domain-containing protein [Hymenobacter sp. B81]|uniref:T9SS type A sorting domain-containing protein n=1 Tax=Hymenobacter sp. B81 TaxID=3344878 RepID=UPI0037DD8730